VFSSLFFVPFGYTKGEKTSEKGERMKVTVVGFWGGYPEKNEATSSYLLEHEGFRLLVDCGSGAVAQLQNYISPIELDAVILSHYHHDHVADIGVLQYARLIQSFQGNGSAVLPVYGHVYDEQGFARLEMPNITQALSYDLAHAKKIGPFTITFLETKHPVTCFAMRITAGDQTIIYTADSSYMEEFIPFSKDADLIICECNFYKNQDGTKAGHMNSLEAGNIAQKANAKELLLTHLPHHGAINHLVTEAKEMFQGTVHLAKSGFTWGTE
jgi:ribonuclease BN (tRNA processing enzyme)